mgnify:CR=1 FL=1
MSIDVTTEKRFESDIEEFFLSPAGGYTHNQDAYDPQLGVYQDTLLRFIQKTQPKEWKRFLLQNKVDPERKFCLAFNNACDMDGLISVLRHGFIKLKTNFSWITIIHPLPFCMIYILSGILIL